MEIKREFLSNVKIEAVVNLGNNICVYMEDDKEKILKSFKWDENVLDFWETITFQKVMYDIHISFDEQWDVSIFRLIQNKNGDFEIDVTQEKHIDEKSGVSVVGEIKVNKEDNQEREKLICAVIEDTREAFENGDSTVLAEILEQLPTSYLKGCLPE